MPTRRGVGDPVASRGVTRTAVDLRPLSPSEHQEFLTGRDGVSFLQTPAWGAVKQEWQHESVGWFNGTELVGAGLVLYRRLPRLKRSLAYLPEGPVFDWSRDDAGAALVALTRYLRSRGAFAVRIGPPVRTRAWAAATVKDALKHPSYRRLGDVPPDEEFDNGHRLQRLLSTTGWRSLSGGDGFGAGQPQYVFWLPLSGRSEEDVLAGMNQQWRRNIKKADKAGVAVTVGSQGDLAAFHDLYVETAHRDGFAPRPLSYFEQMFSAMTAEDPDRLRLYLAHHEQDLVAATTLVQVGRHVWYSYGASSTAKRDVRGSNAVQWRMIRDAMAAGAEVYDLRGITDTLDPDDAHVGLIRFKAGTGGDAVEYVGEWDLPLNRPLYAAFDLYMRRRRAR